MDFDAIIPLLFVIFFFILPSLLKAMKKKKNRPGENKTSLFGRIGEQIGNLLQEIEQQKKQGVTTGNTDDIWSALAKAEDAYEQEEQMPPPELKPRKPVEEKSADIPVVAESRPAARLKQIKKQIHTDGRQRFRYRKKTLQNAVVLTEIIGKPVALK